MIAVSCDIHTSDIMHDCSLVRTSQPDKRQLWFQWGSESVPAAALPLAWPLSVEFRAGACPGNCIVLFYFTIYVIIIIMGMGKERLHAH